MATILNAKCVLVTGATSGIGRALALAIHDLPTRPTVIVTGRRHHRLAEMSALGDRIQPVQLDMRSGREPLKQFAEDIISKHPELDTVIFSAGIQHMFNFRAPETIDLDFLEDEFTTNYVSIVTLIKYFLPHFLQRSAANLPSFIIPVSSGLAIVPYPTVPDYCATKAALHSFCLSLTAQLKPTNVRVMEILPPLTESELHDHQGPTKGMNSFWMTLDEFITETMGKLCRGDSQIPVGSAVGKWEQFEKGKPEFVARIPC